MSLRIPLAALGLVLVLCAALVPGFFSITVQNGHLYGGLVDILNRSMPVAISALGMTFVISTGGIDLSVGSVAAIAGAVLATVGLPPPLAVLSAAIAAAACGLLNGILISFLRVQPIVATLILMTAGRGIAQLICGGQIIPIRSKSLGEIGSGFSFGIPNPIWIGLAIASLCLLIERKTALGLFCRSIGSSEKASSIAGVPVNGIRIAVYIGCAAFAGISGIILAADIGAADANNAAFLLELDAILAACVGGNLLRGGTLSIAGTLVGAFLMQASTTLLLTKGLSAEFSLILKALLVLALGLLGSGQFRILQPSSRV